MIGLHLYYWIRIKALFFMQASHYKGINIMLFYKIYKKKSFSGTFKISKCIKTKQNRGFSLVELLVAVALSGFLTVAVASILIFSVEQFNILVQQHKAEEDLLWASYYVRSYLSQAVNTEVKEVGNSTNKNCHLTKALLGNFRDQGFIISKYKKPKPQDVCSDTPITSLIALFPRENSFSYNTVDLFVSAIFYQRPSSSAGNTTNDVPGKLYIDVGERSGHSYLFAPDSTDIVFSGLSDFELEIIGMDVSDVCENNNSGNVTCNHTHNMAKTAKITLTFRYFLFADDPQGQRYDYGANIRTINAKDLENVIEINFHNNNMMKCKNLITGCNPTQRPAGKERIFGNIYFYKTLMPPETFKPI